MQRGRGACTPPPSVRRAKLANALPLHDKKFIFDLNVTFKLNNKFFEPLPTPSLRAYILLVNIYALLFLPLTYKL